LSGVTRVLAAAVVAGVALLAGCGGGGGGSSSDSAEPLTLGQRLLQAGDLEDLEPAKIPVSQSDFNAGSEVGPWPVLVPGSSTAAGPLLSAAGMVGGRWEPLNVAPPRYAYSLVAQFDSASEAAKRAAVVRDNLARISNTVRSIDVDIPDAKAAAGTANGVTARVVAFSDGPFVYVIGTSSPSGFTDDQVAAAAEKLHDRVEGHPAPR
jgi:hypothetical protein